MFADPPVMAAPPPYRNRLLKELKSLKKAPPDHIVAAPLPSNILEWHFCIFDFPEDSPYRGGLYHGKLLFPKEYPFAPPGIMMITPSGRFATNTRLCLSISDFHPEQWNPSWSVENIIKGLMSFMLETTMTAGSINSSTAEKERLAVSSGITNRKNSTFCELFPEMVTRIEQATPTPAVSSSTRNTSASEIQAQEGGSLLSNAVLLAIVAAFISLVANVLSLHDGV